MWERVRKIQYMCDIINEEPLGIYGKQLQTGLIQASLISVKQKIVMTFLNDNLKIEEKIQRVNNLVGLVPKN